MRCWPVFTAAGAMLTRITSLSFVLPALFYIGIERRADWRPRLRMSALAAGIAVVLTLPYLINCWRISGDPFISINAHTDFYRSGEGIASHAVPMSAVAYVATEDDPQADLSDRHGDYRPVRVSGRQQVVGLRPLGAGSGALVIVARYRRSPSLGFSSGRETPS